MRKSVWIFLIAILVPSAVLGWLALRSAEEQKIILERQTTELYQRETENLAASARALIDEQRRGFAEAVRVVLAEAKPDAVAPDFAGRLAATWPRKAIGFSLGSDGRVLSPAPRLASSQPSWGAFLRDHGTFLDNSSPAPVYNVQVDTLTQTEQLRRFKANESQSQSLWSKTGTSRLSFDSLPASKDAATEAKGQARAPVASRGIIPSPPGGSQTASPLASTRAKEGAKLEKSMAPVKKARQEDMAAPVPAKPAAAARTTVQAPAPAATAPAAKPAPSAPMPQAAPEPAPKPLADLSLTPTAPPSPAENAAQILQELPQDAEAQPLAPGNLTLNLSGNARIVQPQQFTQTADHTAVSNLLPETAEFRTLSEGQNEGILTRFVQDKLALIFWLRPPQAPHLIFGCAIDASDLADLWPQVMPEPRYTSRGGREFVLALLNDRARPVIVSPASETNRDWKRPFVASEVGEALPHWEAALYLMRPEQLQESALGLRRTLIFLIVAMLGAIALGGWLVVVDARRQLALAQQKTDFVSNVSHELKTPLTSIRMFAELMLGGRTDGAKTPQYLRIIMVEAERLTRLINNVLDFAKLERRQKRFDKKPLDLHELIARVWEGHELHLREGGFATNWEAAPPPYRVTGDEDALAQILVNLLANAEKYSAERKEIELHTYFDDHHLCVSVLDRGLGVPAGSERKIFDAFYRAHDSLSSGIQGSGLGLTLAQRLAAEHGGTIEYRARDGGGSAFTLRLPAESSSASPSSSSPLGT